MVVDSLTQINTLELMEKDGMTASFDFDNFVLYKLMRHMMKTGGN